MRVCPQRSPVRFAGKSSRRSCVVLVPSSPFAPRIGGSRIIVSIGTLDGPGERFILVAVGSDRLRASSHARLVFAASHSQRSLDIFRLSLQIPMSVWLRKDF